MTYWDDQYQKNVSYSRLLPRYHNDLFSGENRRILDIGCGTGHLSLELSAMGHDVVGIDPSLSAIILAKRNNTSATFIHSNLEDHGNSSETYEDCIFMYSLAFTGDIEKSLFLVSKLVTERCIVVTPLKKTDSEQSPKTQRIAVSEKELVRIANVHFKRVERIFLGRIDEYLTGYFVFYK